jgi:uncharacterized membrane protein
MSVETVTALDCTCESCSHRWRAAGTKPPSRCPACHSRQWNASAIPRGPFGSRLRTKEQIDAMLQRRAKRREAAEERDKVRVAR